MGAGTNSQILKRLKGWPRPLSRPLEFYRQLVLVQSETGSHMGTPSSHLNGQAAAKRMDAGEPLLRFGDLDIDWPLLQSTLERVVMLVESYPDVFMLPAGFRRSIASLDLLQEAIRRWFEGSPKESGGKASDAAGPVFAAAMQPLLAAHAEVLLDMVDQAQWRRGYCPVCGGAPDFAVLKEDGSRWLLCSRCDAQWLFQRLECPACGNREARTLAYFTDDAGLYRIYVCERCHHYLKAIDLRRATADVLLPLERFLTLHLDIQAHEGGYTPSREMRALQSSI